MIFLQGGRKEGLRGRDGQELVSSEDLLDSSLGNPVHAVLRALISRALACKQVGTENHFCPVYMQIIFKVFLSLETMSNRLDKYNVML